MTSNMKVEEINNGFSTKLKVLVVDDNPGILETLLRQCQYQVTIACSSTTTDFLLQNKNNFDLAIIDVDIPNMDGFMLLQYVGFEMNLPAIMLSSNSNKEFITKGITLGAWDYLIKPVRIEELNKIWQHVTRRNNNLKRKFSEKCQSEELKSADHYNKSNKKRKENDKDYEEKQGQSEISTANNKKNRLVWTPELRNKFVDVINELGVENAVPKKILEMMNDNRLTRENVASHLQKYRLSVKKSSDGKTTHEPNMGYRSSYQPTSSPGIIQRYISLDHGPITTVDSINGLDHHTLIPENGVFANWSSNAPDHSLTQDFSSGLSSLNHEGCPRGAIQPIRYRHADDIDCNDNNTPTSHYPNNQTFFHGNNFGVPQHDQEDGVHQFLQGFYFPQNDQVFNYVNNSENGI